jgi:hypothetical protein
MVLLGCDASLMNFPRRLNLDAKKEFIASGQSSSS